VDKLIQFLKDLGWEVLVGLALAVVVFILVMIRKQTKKLWFKLTGRSGLETEVVALKTEVAGVKTEITGIRQAVDELRRAVQERPRGPSESDGWGTALRAFDDKTNATFTRIEDKTNTNLGSLDKKISQVAGGVEDLHKRLSKIENAKPTAPEPVDEFAAEGVLWSQFEKGGDHRPYCHGCASGGERRPLTPTKQTSVFFLRCAKCSFYTRIEIHQYYRYQAGSAVDDDVSPDGLLGDREIV
jgi:hypothetical protein